MDKRLRAAWSCSAQCGRTAVCARPTDILPVQKIAEQSIFNLHNSDAFHAEIIKTFNLSGYATEPNRTGLALIIPYPHADLTADGILASAIEHFAPAILDGSLQVKVDDRVLDKASIDKIGADVASRIHTEWIREDVSRYLTLLRHAKAAEPVVFDVDPGEKLGARRR